MRLILVLTFWVNSAYAGYLTERDKRVIKQNMKDYEWAGGKVGIPPLILAAIHYRESDLHKGWYSRKRNKVIKNVGGPFMLDMGPLNDTKEFTRRIREHEEFVRTLYGIKGRPKISHNFRFAALVAAHHLKVKERCPIKRINCLADAVYGYNGRAYGKHQNSAYVWSDPKKGKSLTVRYTKKDGTVKEFKDERPGVMIIYKELTSHIKYHKYPFRE